MATHLDLTALYVTGSVLVTTSVVYALHALGSAIGHAVRAHREARARA